MVNVSTKFYLYKTPHTNKAAQQKTVEDGRSRHFRCNANGRETQIQRQFYMTTTTEKEQHLTHGFTDGKTKTNSRTH